MIVETESEENGRWIAEIHDLPGVLSYGNTRKKPLRKRRLWHFVSWPIDWTMARKYRN